jgi:N-acetylneuraminic acid mutarotase
MKTKNKISAYILRGSTGVLLFSCVIVALCSAINLPEQPSKAAAPQDNAAFGANTHQNRSLSFADRVAYQRAIEDVYWRHRIWPNTNPGPKPSLDAVMSQTEIEKKVTAYLRNSQALEDYWQWPITANQLQAEMERMASHTKQPEVLRELFEALGNDPFVIAECLARPVLVERFANGDPVAAGAPPAHPAPMPPQKPALAGWLAKAERQVPMTMAAVSSANYTLPTMSDGPSGCIDDTWTATSITNAPEAREGQTAVWTGTEMIVWGGFDGITRFNTGGRYNPSTDSWTATTTTNAPSGRVSHRAVWTGTEMIVWGGASDGVTFLNTGGRYNPTTDSWTATTLTNAPSPRSAPSVWTGSEMIVWGGFNGFSRLDTGGRYTPGTDSWTATSTANAPSARNLHTAVWTGSEMIVWGGLDGFNSLDTGGRYDPGTDSWTATTTTNVPQARRTLTAVWTGSEMIVWGGIPGPLNTGGRYDPGTDSWTATSTTNAPSARSQHRAVWTGTEMIVWGGVASGAINLNTGGRYDPGTDSWTATSITDAPSVRRAHTAVWTGSEMIVWGGFNGTVRLNTGGRYCAQPSVCVFLQGFWKNHPEAWPVTELQLGNVTYNQQELLSILRQPVRGNGLVLLAHQLIAAKLNIANGADGSCIHQTLADAGSLIGDLVVPPVGNGYLQPKDVAGIAGVLGSYNEGNLCAPSCDNGSLSPRQVPRPHPIPAVRP